MRKSLVIGIANYPDKPLQNPTRDAQLVHEVLQKRGFESTLVLNPDLQFFGDELEKFRTDTTNTRFGLIYFAGHGMEVNGDGYMQPVDFPIPFSGSRLRHQAISIADLLGAFDSINGPKILIIDACRLPFDNFEFDEWRATLEAIRDSRTRGLPAENTFISYSTSAGQVASDGAGENSIFCEEFCSEFLNHESSVEECFKKVGLSVKQRSGQKQLPWYYTSLSDKVTFSDLPRYVLDATMKIPSADIGSILSLYGNETLDYVHISDGDQAVWQVGPRQLRAIARLREWKAIGSAVLKSGKLAILDSGSHVHILSKKGRSKHLIDVANSFGFSWSASGNICAVYGDDGFCAFKIKGDDVKVLFTQKDTGPIYCCHFLDENTFLCGSWGSVRRVSNLSAIPTSEEILFDRYEYFYSISLIQGKNMFAVTTNSGRVLWHDISTGHSIATTTLPNKVQTVAARRQSLLDIALDDVLDDFLRDPESVPIDIRNELDSKITTNRLVFASTCCKPSLLVTISNEGSIYILDNRTQELAQLIADPSGRALGGEGICFLRSGIICSVTTDSTVAFYRPVNPEF